MSSLLSILFSNIFVSVVFSSRIDSVPEPTKYILSFPTNPNPLNITVDPSPEKNYFILLGDWGCQSNDEAGVKMQTGVANKMKTFVNTQKSKGMNLLFIGTVGDNFYELGQNCNDWQFPWLDKYGKLATDYIWLSVKGNHDWASNDGHAMCAWTAPKYIDPVTKIPYAANQINADKGGCNPKNYYLPDFSYYYSIPQLNFEWIALEETVLDCDPTSTGFFGFDGCGNHNNGTIGCNYLGKMRDASENMMRERANTSENTNFLLVEHYAFGPQQQLITEFGKSRGNNSDYIVWSAAGHTHVQECVHYDSVNGVCDQILTGGGGTGATNKLHGFYVIGFDKNKRMIQPYNFNDTQISCDFNITGECGQNFTALEIAQSNIYKCENDPDEKELCTV